jgi:hypothetical protein
MIVTCPGEFVYSMSITPASTLVTLDVLSRTISWSQTMPVGFYSITIDGSLRNTVVLKATTTFSLNIVNICYENSLRPSDLVPKEYIIT